MPMSDDRVRTIVRTPAGKLDFQTYFVRRLSASVNLGNVHAEDVIGCETLRLGLRSDTLLL